MTHALDASLLATLASWVLHVILGVWVLTLKPRRTQTLLLAAYFLLHGLAHSLGELATALDLTWGPIGDPSRHLLYYLEDVLSPLSHLALLALAAWVPHRLKTPGPLFTALAVGFGFSVAMRVGFLANASSDLYAQTAFTIVDVGTFWAPAVLLALRAAPFRDPSVQETTQLAILAVAYAFFAEFTSGGNILGVAEGLAIGDRAWSAYNASILAVWLTIAGIWARNMLSAGPETVRIHRTAMLTILGLGLAGAVSAIAVPDGYQGVVFGIVNTIGVALIAYGVLRHDLAGLDAKVRFGVSKTTLAGVFIAVFFIVSEGAQAMFADFAGNELLGVLAAGALVFFISPLQRLADGVAAKAIPGADPQAASPEREYRRAVEATLADGEVSPGEELHLAELADELGLATKRAYEIRREVQEEASAGETA